MNTHVNLQSGLTLKVLMQTCLRHRLTLIDQMCYKCVDEKPDACQTMVVLCKICYRHVIDHFTCDHCLVCHRCLRIGRFPGFCVFCGLIYNDCIARRTLKMDAGYVFAFLIDRAFDFLHTKSIYSHPERFIDIIAQYL